MAGLPRDRLTGQLKNCPNYCEKPRVSILCNYTSKFVRPMVDPLRDMRQEVIDRASPKLKQLLGYEFQSAIFKDVKRIRSQGWN